jgi:hypothetical protein
VFILSQCPSFDHRKLVVTTLPANVSVSHSVNIFSASKPLKNHGIDLLVELRHWGNKKVKFKKGKNHGTQDSRVVPHRGTN